MCYGSDELCLSVWELGLGREKSLKGFPRLPPTVEFFSATQKQGLYLLLLRFCCHWLSASKLRKATSASKGTIKPEATLLPRAPANIRFGQPKLGWMWSQCNASWWCTYLQAHLEVYLVLPSADEPCDQWKYSSALLGTSWRLWKALSMHLWESIAKGVGFQAEQQCNPGSKAGPVLIPRRSLHDDRLDCRHLHWASMETAWAPSWRDARDSLVWPYIRLFSC